jgi:hypothetical protein
VKCDSCGHKTAVLYVDTNTGEYMPDVIQRCDRENKCGHHYKPSQYFKDHPGNRPETSRRQETVPEEKLIEYIPEDYVEKSMHGFKESYFARYIINLLGETIGGDLLCKYFVGSSLMDNGRACIFWQIDETLHVRYGKIMCYDKSTGKRRKDIKPIKAPVTPDGFQQIFFGCHLLAEHPHKPVAIVESEKTAIICSFFMPQYNWLATGGSSGCKWREYQVYKVLQNKEIIFFPDFGYFNKSKGITCYQEWCERADRIGEVMPCKISVSKILENNLPESDREDGPDMADFLIKPDEHTGIALTDEGYPAIWDYHLIT